MQQLFLARAQYNLSSYVLAGVRIHTLDLSVPTWLKVWIDQALNTKENENDATFFGSPNAGQGNSLHECATQCNEAQVRIMSAVLRVMNALPPLM